ncbi:Choline/ethanolamine kinase [Halotydeus destructor]|nr:Choline/ethanolamine kinase [Halotydeus destructor]
MAVDSVDGADVAIILKVVSKFVEGSWSTAGEQAVTVRPIGGHGNKIYVVQLVTQDDQCEAPSAVVYRNIGHAFMTENDVNIFIGLMQQNLLSFHCGQLGLGPKIYGIYKQCRIEEFIYGRTLTLDDYGHDLVSSQVAQKLARFHYMQLPFERKVADYVQMSQSMLDSLRKRDYQSYPALDTCREMVDQLVQHDYEGDLAWVEKLMPSIPSPVVFCHHDLHNGNVMRLDQPNQNGDQVVLIDFEMAGYGLRAVDIGYFFFFRSIDFGNETLLSGADYPSEDERRSFIVQYLSECDKLGHLKADVDSVSGVLREAEFYGILIALKTVLWLLTIEPVLTTPSLVKCLNIAKKLFDLSQERKQLLSKQCHVD